MFSNALILSFFCIIYYALLNNIAQFLILTIIVSGAVLIVVAKTHAYSFISRGTESYFVISWVQSLKWRQLTFPRVHFS